jgi:gephyrin
MVEDTEVASTTTSDGSEEEKEIKVLAKVDEGENIRRPGSDVRAGEKVLESGTLITGVGGELGTLAFIGRQEVREFFHLFITLYGNAE